MMQQLDHPYPEWYVEGFAEYLSAPMFEHDGSVGIGAPPQRDWSLLDKNRYRSTRFWVGLTAT